MISRRTAILGGTALGLAGVIAACTAGPSYDASEAARLYPPIGRFVTLPDGRKVHYWEQGSGQPLILVHGASGNLRDWTFSIAPKLAKDFRVIAFDRPGFGYTDRDLVRGWDPAVQARTLYLASREIGVEQPIIVGHSWGGALALAWAIQYPDETRGVVPVSGVSMPYRGTAKVFRTLGLDGVVVSAYTNYMKRVAASGGIDRFVARVFRPMQPPEGYLDYVGAPLALRDDTLAANTADIQFVNIALERMVQDYPTLKPRVSIIHGRQDFVSASHHAVPLAQLIPGARLNLLNGVGHMAHHADSDAIRSAALGMVA
ncbi:MAG: alpha/beta hydrolase [Pseudomonadota bacterium]